MFLSVAKILDSSLNKMCLQMSAMNLVVREFLALYVDLRMLSAQRARRSNGLILREIAKCCRSLALVIRSWDQKHVGRVPEYLSSHQF